MFGKQIRRIFCAEQLAQLEAAVSEPLLDAQTLSVYVAQLSQPLSAAYANGRGAVCRKAQGCLDSEVSEHGLVLSLIHI